MKLKYTLSVLAIVAFAQHSYAQYAQDAIRFSNTQTGSTSRIKALGNAGTAVGGDLSNITGNPAGLGFFTKSEISITPEYNGSSTNSLFYGSNTKSNKNSLNLNNASILFYSQLNRDRAADKTKGWLSLNFGVNYARTKNYYDNSYSAGSNPTYGSSVADYIAQQAQLSSYYNGVGQISNLQAGAISDGLVYSPGVSSDGTYTLYSPNTKAAPRQVWNTSRSGGQADYGFSMGANYSNKLYLGLGINFTDIRYNSSSALAETGGFANSNNTYSAIYATNQTTKGSGFNARFGAIYKPVEAVRIGATITTPTWYSIDDVTSEDLYRGNNSSSSGGQDYTASYNLRTPFKASGGLAVFIQQYGFITGDIEYVDYKSTHLSSNDFDVSNDNADIKQFYRSAVNAHVGAEARLTPAFYLRGGYGIQGSPQKDLETSFKTVSGGLGYRFGTYYVDVTYTRQNGILYTQPYLLQADYIAASKDAAGNPFPITNPYVDLKRVYNNVFLTLGARF
ncbi:outer membrane protein transport protein [Mucilaginibacter koreensis]